MPSLDIVSEVEKQEIDNTINSVQREVANRYDFKGSSCNVAYESDEITINADSDYQLETLQDMIKMFASRRKINAKFFDFQKVEKASGNTLRQKVKIKNGIDSDNAKKIMKYIKSLKMKVTAANKGEKIKIEGKKIDDLREVMDLLKTQDFDISLSYENFK